MKVVWTGMALLMLAGCGLGAASNSSLNDENEPDPVEPAVQTCEEWLATITVPAADEPVVEDSDVVDPQTDSDPVVTVEDPVSDDDVQEEEPVATAVCTISEVMDLAFKGNKLYRKASKDEASALELAQLKALIEQMALNTPPKAPEDDPDSWQNFNQALVDATDAVASGEEGGTLALKKAASCGKCHVAHK